MVGRKFSISFREEGSKAFGEPLSGRAADEREPVAAALLDGRAKSVASLNVKLLVGQAQQALEEGPRG